MSQEQTTDIFLTSKVVTPVSLDNQEQFPALDASNMRKDVTISGKKKVTKQPPVFFKTRSSVSTTSSAAVSAQVAGAAKDDGGNRVCSSAWQHGDCTRWRGDAIN